MHLDPVLPTVVGVLLSVLLIGIFLQHMRQPHVVGYLIVGILFGPHAFAVIADEAILSRLGAFGVVFLLFFIGMEVSPRRLMQNWKVAIIGTVIQILLSVACVWLLGAILNWPFNRILLLGFVISLSSTAVVLKMLQDWGELNTHVGQNVLGVLLFQDLAIIPMLIIIGLMGNDSIDVTTLTLQLGGGLLIAALSAWIVVQETIHLPFARWLRKDNELQLFFALIICFGLALLTGLFGLSTALGAFVGGMLVASAKETQWVHHSLEPFRIVFVALFFVSIGLLVDLEFVRNNVLLILVLVTAVMLTNTLINMLILRSLGDSWTESLYAGALLSQIGEFSFVLAAVGLQAGIISMFGHQLTVAVIALSLMTSPAWIALVKKLILKQASLAPPT